MNCDQTWTDLVQTLYKYLKHVFIKISIKSIYFNQLNLFLILKKGIYIILIFWYTYVKQLDRTRFIDFI